MVEGRVQGVFFRDSCAREARAAALAGWIRNRPDGAVEALFEGSPAAVGRLVEWCRHGPPRAVVTRFEVVEVSPAALESFRIQ